MPEARPLSIVVLPSLPTKAVDGWLGNIVFVLITSIWVWGVQGRVAQAWSAGQWWTVLWMSGLLIVLVTLSWKAKVSLFTFARLGASNWANWRATRARGSSTPIDQWTHAWMSLIGCGVMSLKPLARVRRADIERRYRVSLPDLVVEPGMHEIAQSTHDPLMPESSWVAFRIARTREIVAIVLATFASPIACGLLASSISASAPTKALIHDVAMWTAIGSFFAIPLAGGLFISRRLGTVTVTRSRDRGALALTNGRGTRELPFNDVLIGCAHFQSHRSGLLTREKSGLNAIITPTATTPAMRVVLNDPRAFIAALTAPGGQDRPAGSTLPSHDRPQGSA